MRRTSLPIMLVVILAFIVAYGLVIRLQPRNLRYLVVVSAIAVLFVGLTWLSFGYRSFGIPLQALLFPDRVHQGLNVNIPLPPHTVLSGRCSEKGSYYYSRSTLNAIDQFYRSQPSAEPRTLADSKLEFRYGTSVIIAVQRSPRESQLAIDCPMHSSEPPTDSP